MSQKLFIFILTCVGFVVLPFSGGMASNHYSQRNALYKEALQANDLLFQELSRMLNVMEEVAAWKWVNQRAIEDKPQEKKVLHAAQLQAIAAGLDPETTMAFFETQIDLAKKIQQQLHQNWQENGFPENFAYRDLQESLRPEILTTRQNIIYNLKQSAPILRDPKYFENHLETLSVSIQSPYIDEYDKMRLLEAMIAISLKSA